MASTSGIPSLAGMQEPNGRLSTSFYTWLTRISRNTDKQNNSISNIQSQTYGDTFTVSQPENQDYDVLIDASFGFKISSITSKCRSGTCTATFKIGGTALGGNANSVSPTKDPQAHTSDNEVAIGGDLTCTISANSSCQDAIFTIKFTRT